MKKKTIIILGIIFILIILLFQFGIQIGNVRIGKQIDLKTKQDYRFEQSNFYSDFYSKDDLIVLNLWATWCEPCVKEMPELNSIKTLYKYEPVVFLSLSVDTDSLKLEKFNKTEKFKFNDITFLDLKYKNAILNTIENRKVDQWISSYSVPVTYLIKNKKVVAKFDGTVEKVELTNAIEKYK
jgi:thiol-disulfide isomerase/thioredoxin